MLYKYASASRASSHTILRANPPPRSSFSLPLKMPLKSTAPSSTASPRPGALGVSRRLRRSWPALLGKVGNIASALGLGSWRKYSWLSISLALGLFAGFRLNKSFSNDAPAVVSRGNLARMTEPVFALPGGKRSDRALGSLLKPGH